MNEQIGNKINDKTYIKLTPFKGFVLENFPFIEADFDAITNYQLLCKVIEYLNNVISNQNTVQELGTDLVNAYNSLVDAVNLAINEFETDVTADINQFKVDINDDFDEFKTNITNQFSNLQNYVNNYFDNNFPQMISDKLDEMAQDGTLENLLNDTAHLTKSYNTYTDMMADSSTFTNGLRLKTLGYYTINDGGGAEYYVNNSLISSKYQIDLTNGLYLNLIIKDSVTPEQFGAYGDGTHDDSVAIKNAIEHGKSVNFENKTYLCNVAIYTSNVNINGKNTILKTNLKTNAPILGFYGTEDSKLKNISISNINLDGDKENITLNTNCHGLVFHYIDTININNIDIYNIYRASLLFANSRNINVNNYKAYNSGVSTADMGCSMVEMYSSINANFNDIIFDTYFGEGFLIRKSRNINVNNFKASNDTRSGNNAFTTDDCFELKLNNFNIDNINHQGIEINSTENFSITNGKITNCYRNGLMISTYSTETNKASINGVIDNLILDDNYTGGISDTHDILIIGSSNIEINNINSNKVKLSRDQNNINITNIEIKHSIISTSLALSGGADKGIRRLTLYNNTIASISSDPYAEYSLITYNKFEYYERFVLANGLTKTLMLPTRQNIHLNGIINYISAFTGDPDKQFTTKIMGYTLMGINGTFNPTVLHTQNGPTVGRDITIAKGSNNNLTITNSSGVELVVSFAINGVTMNSI